MSAADTPRVGILMGSQSDWPTMKAAAEMLDALDVPHETRPKGIPVGTLAIGEAGAANAGLLAARILGATDTALAARIEAWMQAQADAVAEIPVDDPA